MDNLDPAHSNIEHEAPRKRGRPRVEGGKRDSRGKLKYPRKKKKITEEREWEDDSHDPSEVNQTTYEGQEMWEEEQEGLPAEYIGNQSIDRFGLYIGRDIPKARVKDDDPEVTEAVRRMHASIAPSMSANDMEIHSIAAAPNKAHKLTMVRMIRAYKEKFEKHFSKALKDELRELEKKDVEELTVILEEVKFEVFSKTQPKIINKTFFNLVQNVEGLFGADGLANDMRDEETINDVLTEVSIKYQHYMYVEPEYRLLYFAFSAGMIRQHINKRANHTKDFLNRKVSDDIINKFSDL
jgi:hypothetical protein